ncbi:MAG: tRNA (guanine(10)-N(2))-dimethyltransferase [Aquificae bacterium]|nr:tRNA (guanine(10)-N(2))-dimethyltransferase [Aquificota bacterium]
MSLTRIKEGAAVIEVPQKVVEHITERNEVFYNPAMAVNRDLTVLLLRVFVREKDRPIKVAEPLAASAIRSIRILKEVPSVEKVFINDLSSEALKYARRNLELNEIPPEKVEVWNEDASVFLLKTKYYDYVDLDPFGSPVDFLDATAKALAHRGVAGITATDTAPLSGTYPKTCLRRYGAKPIDNEFYHEVGVRILIKKVAEVFFQYDLPIEVLFSYAYLHHFRVFVKRYRGARRVDELVKNKFGYLLYCHRCLYRSTVPLVRWNGAPRECPVCGHRLDWAGPLWVGELWNPDYAEEMLKELPSVEHQPETKKLLKAVVKESKLQTVGFYETSALGKALKLPFLPPKKVLLRELEGVETHFSPEGFRTNLPHEEVLKRVRNLVRE